MGDFKDFSRIGMSCTFVRIARKNYKLMISYLEQLEANKKLIADTKDESDCWKLEYEEIKIRVKLDEYSLNTIIFAALSAEAYIYDYAARNLSDSFVKEHLEKLDIVSKWLIVPKLVTGKMISKGENAYCLLKNLISVRNSIMHNKSVKAPSTDDHEFYENLNKKEMKFLETAKNALNTIDALAEKIEEFDPNENAKFWLNYKGMHNGEFDDL